MKNEKKTHPGVKKEAAKKHAVVKQHAEWELEKQTEGLTPSVVKASEQLEHEMEREAKHKKS